MRGAGRRSRLGIRSQKASLDAVMITARKDDNPLLLGGVPPNRKHDHCLLARSLEPYRSKNNLGNSEPRVIVLFLDAYNRIHAIMISVLRPYVTLFQGQQSQSRYIAVVTCSRHNCDDIANPTGVRRVP